MDASLEKVGTEGSGGAAVPGLRLGVTVSRGKGRPGAKESRRRRASGPRLDTSRGSVAEGGGLGAVGAGLASLRLGLGPGPNPRWYCRMTGAIGVGPRNSREEALVVAEPTAKATAVQCFSS